MLNTVLSIDSFSKFFTIAPRLNHLGYWLAGRDRHLLSLLKASPFKILLQRDRR